jgi:cyanate permease
MDIATETAGNYHYLGVWITILASAAAICSVVAVILARRKRRDQQFWFIGCFVFPPLLVILILLPPSRRGRSRGVMRDSEGNGLDTFHLAAPRNSASR